jgi:hypothetical protein
MSDDLDSGFCTYVEFDVQNAPGGLFEEVVGVLEQYGAVSSEVANGNFSVTLTIEQDNAVEALRTGVALASAVIDKYLDAKVVGGEVTTYPEQARRAASR